MWRRKLSLIALISLVALLLAACQADPNNDSMDTVTIESINLSPSETETIVSINGYLPNACYSLSDPDVTTTTNKFTIVISAVEVAEVCSQALVSFEEVVELNTSDLSAGTYTVMVNNEVREFTIQ